MQATYDLSPAIDATQDTRPRSASWSTENGRGVEATREVRCEGGRPGL